MAKCLANTQAKNISKMIDGIKLHANGDDAIELFHHHLLEFEKKVNNKTGEIVEIKNLDREKGIISRTTIYEAKFRNVLSFIYKKTEIEVIASGNKRQSNNVEISGSVHKLFADGENDSDFTFNNFISIINYLIRIFKINPSKFTVQNLEFGVNIITGINASQLITQTIFYKTQLPEIRLFNNCGLMKTFPCSQYDVKIYDKGLQTNAGLYNLRFEIKARKNEYLKFARIDTLDDLLKNEVWQKLAEHLYSVFSKLLIYENIEDKLPDKQKLFYVKGMNANHWNKLRKKSPNKFKYDRIKFNKLTDEHGNNLKKETLQLIKEKTFSLLDVNWQ